jgi:hypothetical protein
MRTPRSVLLALAAFALLVPAPALLGLPGTASLHAQRGKSGKPETSKKAPSKKEYWAVVQVGEDFEVVKKSELKTFTKGFEDRYRADMKAWNDSKKAAHKAKEKFDAPKPVKPKVKVIRKNFKFEAEAKTHATMLKNRQAKKGAKGEAYVVVNVDGSLRVASKSELASMKKDAAEGYKRAVKEHAQAKKDAAKRKQKFDDPKPKKSTIKSVGKSFASKEQAEEYLQKLLAKKSKKDSAGKSKRKKEKKA